MATVTISALAGKTAVITDEIEVQATAGGASNKVTALSLIGILMLEQLRLYSTSGVPVPVSDTATVNTIYVGPFNGNKVTLLDGSDNPVGYVLTEISLALSGLTSGKPYDVFLYDNAGALAIELSAAWTNDTTRSDAVATVNGLVVKSSNHTRLHVGTIYTTGTTSTADTAAKRYVWNRYNQRPASMLYEIADMQYNYTTATWRQANSNTANQLDYVTGDQSTVVDVNVNNSLSNTNSGVFIQIGIGVSSTTVNSAVFVRARTQVANGLIVASAQYRGRPGLGRYFLPILEYSQAAGTTTWYGSGSDLSRGITGIIQN